MGVMRSDLKQDYVYFIISIAMMNNIYCIDIIVFQPIIIFGDYNETSTLCQVTGFFIIFSASSAILTQPLLALNRCSAIFDRNKHSEKFSKKNIAFMLLFIYLLSFVISFSFWLLNDYGKLHDTICSLNLGTMPSFHLILIFLLPSYSAYAVSIICAWKISRFLKKHESETRRLEIRTMVRETKQIVKLIFIEIFVPLALECPAFMMVILIKYIPIEPILFSIAIGCFVGHNITDPLVVVFVIKPYRLAMKQMLNKLRNNTVSGSTMSTNVELSVVQKTNFSNFLS